MEPEIYEFGKFRFDPKNQLLLGDGNPIPLAPKAFDVLLVLVQNGSRLTSKEELMTKVWPNCFVEEANLTINISALRKALRESADGQQYIETVPKRGYRFVTPVKTVSDLPALDHARQPGYGMDARAPIAEPEKAVPKRRHLAGWMVGLVSALLCLILASMYLFFGGTYSSRFAPAQSHRLAVLPFQNLRENRDSDFLGFSLADAVITKLSYVSELTVRPSYDVQNTSFSQKTFAELLAISTSMFFLPAPFFVRATICASVVN